jgi:hypothetical protein
MPWHDPWRRQRYIATGVYLAVLTALLIVLGVLQYNEVMRGF